VRRALDFSCLWRDFPVTHSTVPRTGPVVIVAGGRLAPRLAALARFLLAATIVDALGIPTSEPVTSTWRARLCGSATPHWAVSNGGAAACSCLITDPGGQAFCIPLYFVSTFCREPGRILVELVALWPDTAAPRDATDPAAHADLVRGRVESPASVRTSLADRGIVP
jgi:hypothetical protein